MSTNLSEADSVIAQMTTVMGLFFRFKEKFDEDGSISFSTGKLNTWSFYSETFGYNMFYTVNELVTFLENIISASITEVTELRYLQAQKLSKQEVLKATSERLSEIIATFK